MAAAGAAAAAPPVYTAHFAAGNNPTAWFGLPATSPLALATPSAPDRGPPRPDPPAKRARLGDHTMPAGRSQMQLISSDNDTCSFYQFDKSNGQEGKITFLIPPIAEYLKCKVTERNWPVVLCLNNSDRFKKPGENPSMWRRPADEKVISRVLSRHPYAVRGPLGPGE